jgi:metal-dependent amidase/aminoacylase/carboxypeptidase family protein
MAGNPGLWRNVIEEVFSSKRDTLAGISKFLWENPETSFNEVNAHTFLTDFLQKEGFQVEKKFVANTGFRAVFSFDGPLAGNGMHEAGEGSGDAKVPHVCFLCEYDATEQVGHAAGHNLKSAASIAAALSIQQCLKQKLFKGKVHTLIMFCETVAPQYAHLQYAHLFVFCTSCCTAINDAPVSQVHG